DRLHHEVIFRQSISPVLELHSMHGQGAARRWNCRVFQVEHEREGRLRIRFRLALWHRTFAKQQSQQRAVDIGSANLAADVDVAGTQSCRMTFANFMKQLQLSLHVHFDVDCAAHRAEVVELDHFLSSLALGCILVGQRQSCIRTTKHIRIRHNKSPYPRNMTTLMKSMLKVGRTVMVTLAMPRISSSRVAVTSNS